MNPLRHLLQLYYHRQLGRALARAGVQKRRCKAMEERALMLENVRAMREVLGSKPHVGLR